MKGIIKKFDEKKGFGFIKSKDVEEDIFFHYSALIVDGFKTILPGAKVDFKLIETEKGKQGRSIKEIKED